MNNSTGKNDSCTLVASCKLPTKYHHGTEVEMLCFDYEKKQNEVIALVHKTKFSSNFQPLVRIHSACITGEVFGSEKCDCGQQFDDAMEQICSSNYGVMLYMTSHEGRGVGIKNKILAYQLQEHGANTLEANELLGLPRDIRDFMPSVAVLKYFNIDALHLISNNPEKRKALERGGIHVIEQIYTNSKINAHNKQYLLVKQNILKHNFRTVIS